MTSHLGGDVKFSSVVPLELAYLLLAACAGLDTILPVGRRCAGLASSGLLFNP